MEPTEADKAEAQKLYSEGYLPVSNKYRLAGRAPANEDTAVKLAEFYKGNPGVEHWRKLSKADQRDHLARMTHSSKTLGLGVYIALKKLCGVNNRGV